MTPIIKGRWDEKTTFPEMIRAGKIIWICRDMDTNFRIREYGFTSGTRIPKPDDNLPRNKINADDILKKHLKFSL